MNVLLTVALIGAGLYLTVALGLYFFQRRLIYYPDTRYITPVQAGLRGVEEVKLRTPDGETLIAWWSPPANGAPTLLYFHGNAGGLANRAPRIDRFARAGYGVFMMAYRGYAGSSGKPSEAALIADAKLAYQHLRERGLKPHEIIPYGESLGTGVATQVAASNTVGALILDAPYTSLPDVGKRFYPYMPVGPFMVDRFESDKHILKVSAPLLILHGTLDTTIPIEIGRALFSVAPAPKEMAEIQGAGHSDIYLFGAMERLQDFLTKHRRATRLRTPEPVE